MRKYFFIILILFVINTLSAQDTCNVESKNLKHGIQFQIRTLSLVSFNSYTFAYRYLLSESSGLRIGLLTKINKDEVDANQKVDNISYNAPSTNKNYNLKLSFQYLARILQYEKFSLIIGAGSFVGYTNDEYTQNNVYTGYQRKSKYSEKGFNYGIDIIAGTEYNLYKNVVLSGEYGLSFMFSNKDIYALEKSFYPNGNSNYSNEKIGKKNEINIDGFGVHLGISIFF